MSILQVSFVLDKPKKEETIVLLRLTKYPEIQIRVSTKIKINTTTWDFKKQEMKYQCAGASQINLDLDDYKAKAIKAYNELVSGKNKPTKEQIKQLIQKRMFEEEKIENRDLFDYFEEFMNEKKHSLSERRIYVYQKVKNHLKLFEKNMKIALNIHTFNDKLLMQYEVFCRSKNPLYLENETVNTDTKAIKAFLKWCNQNDYTENLKYQRYKPLKNVEKNNITLEVEEFIRLRDLDLSDKPHLEYVRDIFFFSFFIDGIRISDLMKMKHENIQENRINYIETKTKKIKKTYIPDIGIDILKRLIDKKTHPIKEKNKDSTKVVKQITAQYFNREIKEICKMANINSLEPVRTKHGKDAHEEFKPKYELISHKTARKTFVTLLSNAGMNSDQISLLTGHSDRDVVNKHYNNQKVENLIVQKNVIFNQLFK